MLKVITLLLAIIYLSVNTVTQIVTSAEAHDAIKQGVVHSLMKCDSGMLSSVADGECSPVQQNIFEEDLVHCYVYHFNSVALVATDFRPACDLARNSYADVPVNSLDPNLIKKPPRILS